jgi:hypothetical protein
LPSQDGGGELEKSSDKETSDELEEAPAVAKKSGNTSKETADQILEKSHQQWQRNLALPVKRLQIRESRFWSFIM